MGIDYQDTSREAWDSFMPVSAQLDRQIMGALALMQPCSCEKIELLIGRSHQAVSGNLRHLVEKGWVVPADDLGVTKSGRRATRWKISTVKTV